MRRAAALIKPLTLLLLASAAFASTGLQFDTSPIRDIAGPKKHDPGALKADGAQVSLSDADIVETHARPLFSASRRPFVARSLTVESPQVEEQAEPVMVSQRHKSFRLLGVNLSGGSFTALVLNRDSEEVRWIKRGENFDGWVLKAADEESAHFECADGQGDDCKYDVDLYVAHPSE
jgi:hypothetical protein